MQWMRIINLLVFFFWIFPAICFPAMSALSNDDLGLVEADAGSPGQSRGPDEILHENPAATQSAREKHLMSPIRQYISSPKFQQFMQYMEQLQCIARAKSDPSLITSQNFQIFWDQFNGAIQNSFNQLTELKQTHNSPDFDFFVNIQKRMLLRVQQFDYQCAQYRQQHGEFPNVQQLVNGLQIDLHSFEKAASAMDAD